MSATTTIRISERTHATLHALSDRAGVPMQVLVERAVELYRRYSLLEQANAAYAALREDRQAWEDLQAERAEWDATLTDGLEDV